MRIPCGPAAPQIHSVISGCLEEVVPSDDPQIYSQVPAMRSFVLCTVHTSEKVLLLSVRYGALNVQAGTLFCDSDFQEEVGNSSLLNSHMQCYVAQPQPCKVALG